MLAHAAVLAMFAFASLQLNAQVDLDSLRSVWEDPSRADTVRFDAFYRVIGAERHTALPDTVLRNAELLTAFAEKRGLKKRVGMALNVEGNAQCAKGRFDEATKTYERGLEVFRALGDRRNEAVVLNGLSNACSVKGDIAQSIEYLTRSLRIAEEFNDSTAIARVLGNIGVSYHMQEDYVNALDYYRRRIVVADAIGDKQCASEAWNNIAIIHLEQGDTLSALKEFERCQALAEEVGDETGVMYALMSIGGIHADQGDHARGMELFHRSFKMAEAMGDSAAMGRAYTEMGESFRDRGDMAKALDYTNRSMALAQRSEDVTAIRDAALLAYSVHKARGESKEALRMHELYITLRDSVSSDENRQAIMQQRFQYDYDKKEALMTAEQDKKDAVAAEELRRKNLQRNAFIGGFGLMVLLAGVFFTQRNRISKEKKRSEELLLNILPAEVAEELKAKGEAEAKLINEVTVLFTDFKGFTAMSEKLTAKELVADIHECFSAFDHIMTKHSIEKIKTIGDAYMAAGGLPTPNDTHALDVVNAALEIRDFIAEGKARKVAAGLPYFEIRIGVHTGPVVAGIVGVKKFAYDIWGDTVNIASRMESSGEVGQVNISESTHMLVKNEPGFSFTPRGKVQAKGKGEMEMYFVYRSSHRRPAGAL